MSFKEYNSDKKFMIVVYLCLLSRDAVVTRREVLEKIANFKTGREYASSSVNNLSTILFAMLLLGNTAILMSH